MTSGIVLPPASHSCVRDSCYLYNNFVCDLHVLCHGFPRVLHNRMLASSHHAIYNLLLFHSSCQNTLFSHGNAIRWNGASLHMPWTTNLASQRRGCNGKPCRGRPIAANGIMPTAFLLNLRMNSALQVFYPPTRSATKCWAVTNRRTSTTMLFGIWKAIRRWRKTSRRFLMIPQYRLR